MIEPRIVEYTGGRICGASAPMSLQSFAPRSVWEGFMPQLMAVQNRLNDQMISLRQYDGIPVFGPTANPSFTYWAGVEVTATQEGLQTLAIPAGTYAVFEYEGNSSESTIWRFIYGKWIPHSEWELDDRPHFEKLGAQYQDDSEDSHEQIWIPVRPRS